jgi:dUTP pyrophosphatase
MNPILKVRRLRDNGLPLPSYQSPGASGIDLMADLDLPVTLAPMERRAIPTGITIAIPSGYEGQIRPRSGRALNDGLTMVNSPGTIDHDYRGELKVLAINLGANPVTISHGDRIAQLIIAPVARAQIAEVSDLDETRRGSGGFGHTGQ